MISLFMPPSSQRENGALAPVVTKSAHCIAVAVGNFWESTRMLILDEELWEKGAQRRSSMRQLRRFVAKLLDGQPVTAGERQGARTIAPVSETYVSCV